MKKLISLLLILSLSVGMICMAAAEPPEGYVPRESVYSGPYSCFILDDGTLEINWCSSDIPQDLNIPEELEGRWVSRLGDHAFMGDPIVTVTIPDSVTDIGDNPFMTCFMLEEIIVSPDHPALEVLNGMLISKADRRLVCCPRTYAQGDYVIPEGISEIGAYALYMSHDLTSVTIPDGVLRIGKEAFADCSMEAIMLPDSIIYIDPEAFNQTFSVFVVPEGSYAEQYCIENNLSYVYPLSGEKTELPVQHDIQVGMTVQIGSYEQDNNPDNGPEPIDWIVMDAQDNKVLLLSKYGLDAFPYNVVESDTTWELCSLREWLNIVFWGMAFDPEIQDAILDTQLDNSLAQAYPHYDIEAGEDTEDRIFLLSYHEAFDLYFHNDEDRMCAPTEYAIANGAWENMYGHKKDGLRTGIWWLRSPSYKPEHAAAVNDDGLYFLMGRKVTDENIMIRPAFWLDLSDLSIQ